jgi:AmmeMemoRadiSam system protein B
MTAIQKIRPSPIAGSWYSGDEKKLRAQVNGFMERAHPAQVPGELIGLVSPHAGYAYSGPTAGYSYACVQGKSYDLVVIASPLHEYLPYPFITSAHAIYGTPLGNVPVDVDLLERLQTMVQEQAGINIVAVANDPEHSLEIQLPFLQCALANPFSLLPIMVRSEDPTSLYCWLPALIFRISLPSIRLRFWINICWRRSRLYRRKECCRRKEKIPASPAGQGLWR